MLRPLVLLLLEVNLVTAFRDNRAVAHQKSTICFRKCCRAKCSGQSYSLKAESKGEWQFHDCRVRKGARELHGYGRMCIEDCTVLHSKEPREAIVMRRSGRGASPQCELYHRDLGLQELSMDFVEQLETVALKLTDGNYGDLPLMKAGKVESFLKKVQQEVLKPEFDQQGYSQEINATKNAVIIGDLHAQLFNLIAYMLHLKSKLKDKGFSTLEGSSLLFCDPRMQYVFMGDYVDRGERGVELLLLLLAYKARCPQGIILLQGNHETTQMWYKYGFAAELQWKFDGNLHPDTVAEVVELLPYVAVAPEKWMAMHGGLSPELKSACTGQGGHFSECLTKAVGQSTVWADPHDGSGFIPSHRGPQFSKFGMDMAEAFLKSNDLKGIFRGHEQVQKGFLQKEQGDYFVTTVFSAADYVGLFCPNDKSLPGWDKEMFSFPGEGNYGGLVLADLADGSLKVQILGAGKTRELAQQFTKARCKKGISLLEESPSESAPKVTLESFMENHKSIKRLGGGHFDSCSLDKDERDALKEKTRQILTNSENREFEARKLIDLEGEALTHGENLEICKAIKKDKVVLEVYHELHGTDEKILEYDIETREIDLEEAL